MSGGRFGVDVGGTKVAIRVEGAGRTHEAGFRWQPTATTDQDLAELARAVDAVRAEWGDPVTSVGVAMPATLGPDGRVVTWPNRPSWAGLDVRAAFAGLFPGVPVVFGDDGDLAALAEADHIGCPDLVYVGVGTGIGGGIVLGGRLYPGQERGSCEIGHLVVDRSGPRCDCGRVGCVQAVASGPATLRRAGLAFADLRAGWLAGERAAVAAVGESAAAVATALVGVGELVHPSLAVVGGGFAEGLPGYVAEVAERVLAMARPGTSPVAVRPATLGGLSSLNGAVLLAGQVG